MSDGCTPTPPSSGRGGSPACDPAIQRCPQKKITKITIESVTFKSDHGLLKDRTADWNDGGSAYSKPEWTASNQHPITHTMDKEVKIEVKIKVEPAGAASETGTLRGEGPGGLVFEKKNMNFAPGIITETLTSSTKLPKKVQILSFKIKWKITGTSVSITPNEITNKMYVTYGTPHGSMCTQKRIEWLCSKCNGISNLTQPSSSGPPGIAEAIYNAFASSPPKFNLISPNVPSNLWLLMSSTSCQGQCIDLAKLMKLAVELLGGTASIGYVYGSTDSNCFSMSDNAFEPRTCPGGSHGGELIRVWSAGGWNNWEAICKVETICYAVKVYKGTPIQILRHWLGPNTTSGNYQGWRYWDTVTSSWKLCTSPGPCPVSKP